MHSGGGAMLNSSPLSEKDVEAETDVAATVGSAVGSGGEDEAGCTQEAEENEAACIVAAVGVDEVSKGRGVAAIKWIVAAL